MRRLRHAVRLLRKLVGFSIVNQVWWPVPVAILLLSAGMLILAAEAAVQFTVYTLF